MSWPALWSLLQHHGVCAWSQCVSRARPPSLHLCEEESMTVGGEQELFCFTELPEPLTQPGLVHWPSKLLRTHAQVCMLLHTASMRTSVNRSVLFFQMTSCYVDVTFHPESFMLATDCMAVLILDVMLRSLNLVFVMWPSLFSLLSLCNSIFIVYLSYNKATKLFFLFFFLV